MLLQPLRTGWGLGWRLGAFLFFKDFGFVHTPAEPLGVDMFQEELAVVERRPVPHPTNQPCCTVIQPPPNHPP